MNALHARSWTYSTTTRSPAGRETCATVAVRQPVDRAREHRVQAIGSDEISAVERGVARWQGSGARQKLRDLRTDGGGVSIVGRQTLEGEQRAGLVAEGRTGAEQDVDAGRYGAKLAHEKSAAHLVVRRIGASGGE